MAGVATAALAVSVIVTNPATGPAPSPTLEQHAFSAPASASLASSLESWSHDSGLAAPQIDARVAALSVGNLTVTGGNVCDAVRRLVSALKYAEQRPEMVACDAAPGGRIVVGSAQR